MSRRHEPRDEARLLAQFDHPSLVKVYRFWEANGTAYMVMPFLEGTTLKDVLRALGASRALVSLTHERSQAAALVLLLRDGW